jgi:hypothetical protein
MKILFSFLLIAMVSKTSFAYQCGSLFKTSESTKNLELLNSLKRIRNFGYFSNLVLIDSLHDKMNVVVFDIHNDGVIENRPSLEEYIQELRSFGSEIRFVYNEQTKDQVLVSRLAKNPKERRQNNLLSLKYENSISLVDNLKRTETINESFNYEVFQSVVAWLAKPGHQLNVIVIPQGQEESFVEMAKKIPHFVVEPMNSVIDKMDPL